MVWVVNINVGDIIQTEASHDSKAAVVTEVRPAFRAAFLTEDPDSGKENLSLPSIIDGPVKVVGHMALSEILEGLCNIRSYEFSEEECLRALEEQLANGPVAKVELR
jgi:hypothetical protein